MTLLTVGQPRIAPQFEGKAKDKLCNAKAKVGEKTNKAKDAALMAYVNTPQWSKGFSAGGGLYTGLANAPVDGLAQGSIEGLTTWAFLRTLCAVFTANPLGKLAAGVKSRAKKS
jgi:hypothetical protein